jgi:hypothetical protein
MNRVRRAAASSLALAAAVLGHAAGVDVTTFHRDPGRTGWDDAEAVLTPAAVHRGLKEIWQSPPFDALDGMPARLYASPLYIEHVRMASGAFAGRTFNVVLAASSNGFVYAVNALQAGRTAPGAILWKVQLGKPCTPGFDSINMGVLSTPVVDVKRSAVYVAACEAGYQWQAFALNLESGEVLPHWPVSMTQDALTHVPQNMDPSWTSDGKRPFFGAQRGALNLSPDGTRLYVAFGESVTGWILALDTQNPAVAAGFAVASLPHNYAGGIWGAGGPAVDADGRIFLATGTSFAGLKLESHDWVQSVLELSDSATEGFVLRGTYTPFNYCSTAAMDIDLGSGGVALLPELSAGSTDTPQLLAVGGKQGNVYLLDRRHLPGKLDERPPCGTDPGRDPSLLAPDAQPQFGGPGPLNVFGPYTETTAAIDQARSRSVPAYFRGSDQSSYLFVTGSTKAAADSTVSVPPSLARLRIVTHPGRSAYLAVDQVERDSILENPGSPIVTSHRSRSAIMWVLDENAPRTRPLNGNESPQPVLYAFDALSLKLLWRSEPGALHSSGKYNEPTIARGTVFVGTDRIQAFGLAAGSRAPQ